KLALILQPKLPPFLFKSNAEIHMDGSYTVEKELAHTTRISKFQEDYKEQIALAALNIEKVTEILQSLGTSGIPSTAQKK
ncbi:hypothetical protein BGX28_001551, partial [Mortierella sp. GBA30]